MIKTLLQKAARLQLAYKIVVVVVFVGAGVVLSRLSGAAPMFFALEPEAGTFAGAARVYDSTASGGSAVRFSAATPAVPTPSRASILNELFDGRGQAIGNGTLMNASNSFAQINAPVTVTGFYVNDRNSYTNAPNSAVLPAFDGSRKVSGSYSGRFGLHSVGRTTRGGSFYHYHISSPKPVIHTKFWWQFDTAMGNAGGTPALATYRTGYSGQQLTYLRFGAGRNLYWQHAGNWTNSSSNYQYQPGVWYRVGIEINANTDQSILEVKNTDGVTVQRTVYPIPNVSQVGFFEFGALQGELQRYTSTGNFWYDDVLVGDTPIQ